MASADTSGQISLTVVNMRHGDLKKCISHILFTFSTFLSKKHELMHAPTRNHSTFQHLQALILLILLFVRQWTHQDNTWMLLQILFIKNVNILITDLSFYRFKPPPPLLSSMNILRCSCAFPCFVNLKGADRKVSVCGRRLPTLQLVKVRSARAAGGLAHHRTPEV